MSRRRAPRARWLLPAALLGACWSAGAAQPCAPLAARTAVERLARAAGLRPPAGEAGRALAALRARGLIGAGTERATRAALAGGPFGPDLLAVLVADLWNGPAPAPTVAQARATLRRAGADLPLGGCLAVADLDRLLRALYGEPGDNYDTRVEERGAAEPGWG